ncbi:MAG: type II secretion system F family protein [Acetobacteraceae bacterium]
MNLFSPLVLLPVGLAVLVGFATSGLMVARAQAEMQRLEKRIGAVLRPHARARRFVFASALTKAAAPRQSALSRLSRLFGYDSEHPEHCPLPWWAVVGIALAFAKGVQVVATLLLGRIGWIALPVVWIYAARWLFDWFISRRRTRLLVQFPDTLTMIVRSVRVGVPVAEAMRVVAREVPAPTGPEFETVIRRLSIGAQLDDTLHELAARSGLSEYRFFAMALALQNQTGGGLSEALEGLADMIRRRLAVKERGKALASEAQMSIYVLSALPPLCGLALSVMNPQYFQVLLTDPTGRRLLGGAVALLALGWFVMRQMMRKSLS